MSYSTPYQGECEAGGEESGGGGVTREAIPMSVANA